MLLAVRREVELRDSLKEDPMETLIGVFASRERAEETIKELLDKHVPQEVVFPILELDPSEKSSEESKFSGEALAERPSLILVRTDQKEIARLAADILDRMGISAQWRTSGGIKIASRQVGGIAIVDAHGVITVGVGNILLREIVANLLKEGNKKLLLNLRGVEYVDSAGLGELVKTHTTLARHGGQLKIVNLNKKVQDLFKLTGLDVVFDVYEHEANAIQSFGSAKPS
jgi:anti-sigma B factor antagonist